MKIIKKDFIGILLSSYFKNKEEFWKSIGPLVSFSKIYCEDIANDKSIKTIENLLEKNEFSRKLIIMEINCFLRDELRKIKNLRTMNNELEDFYKSYKMAMELKNQKISDSNFSDFIWFTKYIQEEKNIVILNILNDIRNVSVGYISLKYKYQSSAVYKKSDLYLKDINEIINKYKTQKTEKDPIFKIVKKEKEKD